MILWVMQHRVPPVVKHGHLTQGSALQTLGTLRTLCCMRIRTIPCR